MSANTSPDNITYPVSTDQVAPLETVFATMASSVQTALTNRYNALTGTNAIIPGMPVASAAARNAMYPSPIQGNRVWRLDGGYAEAYYGLYNSSTNPAGATPAGWYPTTPNSIAAQVRRSATAITISASSYDNISTNTLWTTTGGSAYSLGMSAYSNGWVAPIKGMWEIYWSIGVSAGGSFLAGVSVNNATPSAGNLLGTQTHTPVQSLSYGSSSVIVSLNAGDTVRLFTLAGSGTPPLAVNEGLFGIRWAARPTV